MRDPTTCQLNVLVLLLSLLKERTNILEFEDNISDVTAELNFIMLRFIENLDFMCSINLHLVLVSKKNYNL